MAVKEEIRTKTKYGKGVDHVVGFKTKDIFNQHCDRTSFSDPVKSFCKKGTNSLLTVTATQCKPAAAGFAQQTHDDGE
jgi:hypothetical protein